jgi:hypothetical protein
LSRKIYRKIWQRSPHTFELQLGKKKDTNDSNSNHAYLVKKLVRGLQKVVAVGCASQPLEIRFFHTPNCLFRTFLCDCKVYFDMKRNESLKGLDNHANFY